MDFSFPFPPYPIQSQLMNEIYECIRTRQVGIFESPTGTGKSLSVLCSTMTWLEEEEKRIDSHLETLLKTSRQKIAELDADTKGDWVEIERRKKVLREEEDKVLEEISNRERMKERLDKASKGILEGAKKKRKAPEDDDVGKEEPEDEAAPEDYYSDGEGKQKDTDLIDGEEEKEPLKCVKIFYASRTHSQLEQLVDELNKTRFRPRVVTCGSRVTLCVNEDVTKLKSIGRINERCMELRKNGGGSSDKRQKTENGGAQTKKKKCGTSCEFYNCTQIEDVVNGVLSKRLQNTLEVVKQAKQSKGCPYFATRKAVPFCELVLLPYNVLLHEGTRKAWGIDLSENVVVLDEAHNVLTTINDIYSTDVSAKCLQEALRLIREYIETYKLRLKAKNLLYMKQLEAFTNRLLVFISSNNPTDSMSLSEFSNKLNIVGINPFKLSAYMEKTKLSKKFQGFYQRSQKAEIQRKKENETPKLKGIQKLLAKKAAAEAAEKVPETEEEAVQEAPRSLGSPLYAVEAFINALMNRCEDGRIIVEKTSDLTTTRFKYILLNPSDRLSEIVKSSRSTILIGGTMEPSEILVRMLERADCGSIRRFTCSHVINDSQLLAVAISRTHDGVPFRLNYQHQSDKGVLKRLSTTLLKLIPRLPNGVVVFLPSYKFTGTLMNSMKENGVLKSLSDQKPIFFENPQKNRDGLWNSYSQAARTTKGAVLFAVMGGKMSEGINFSDELGRAVIVIGLPYPNRQGPELNQRIQFMDKAVEKGGDLLYESMCMHSVNQAIGRAIRHRNDYAAVYLFDERFGEEKTRRQLSQWIGSRLQKNVKFDDVLSKSDAFFATNSKK